MPMKLRPGNPTPDDLDIVMKAARDLRVPVATRNAAVKIINDLRALANTVHDLNLDKKQGA